MNLFRHFIDDITYLLSVVVGDTDMEEEEGCFKLSPEEKDTLASLPVFLSGEIQLAMSNSYTLVFNP